MSKLTIDQKVELTRLNKWVEREQFAERKSDELGAAIGKKLLAVLGEGTAAKARVMAVILDHLMECEPDHDCQDLLLRWVREHYWGLVVERHLEMFDQIHAGLVDGKHTRKDPLIYGDIDCGTWFEPCELQKVVVLEVYCSCANDNTWLYMRPKNNALFSEFHCRTCYPKANKKKWPQEVSLATHRRAKFNLGYGDCRDSGYAFSYQQMISFDGKKYDAKVDHADDVKTYWALWNMRGIALALKDKK